MTNPVMPEALYRAMLMHHAADALRLQLTYVTKTLGAPGDTSGPGAVRPSLFATMRDAVLALENAVLDDAGLDRNPVIVDDTVEEDYDPDPYTAPRPDWCGLLDARAADVRNRLAVAVVQLDELIERIAAVAATGVLDPE